VETSLEELDAMVRETLYSLVGDDNKSEVLAWKYLQPGRPNPTHWFSEVVS